MSIAVNSDVPTIGDETYVVVIEVMPIEKAVILDVIRLTGMIANRDDQLDLNPIDNHNVEDKRVDRLVVYYKDEGKEVVP